MASAVARSFTAAPYEYEAARAIAGELGLSEPVAVTLVRRGYGTVEQAQDFLAADERHDPFACSYVRTMSVNARSSPRCASWERPWTG